MKNSKSRKCCDGDTIGRGTDRKKEYLVVWKGWPLSDATWLPMEDIRPRENFENMIERDNPVQDTGGGSSA